MTEKNNQNKGCTEVPIVMIGILLIIMVLSTLFESKSSSIDTLYGNEDEVGIISQLKFWVFVFIVIIGINFYNSQKTDKNE
jgi:hypothetical protein